METQFIQETAMRKPAKLCRCKACGEEFEKPRLEAEFCGPKCRKAWHNLAMVRGRDLYPLVMVWRDQSAANKPASKEAFSAICRLVAYYREEDAEAGVPRRYDNVRSVKGRLAHIFNTRIVGMMRAGR